MNTTEPRSTDTTQATRATDHADSGGRSIRFWSVLSAVLFIPAALAVGLLTLASEQAGRCVTYGEQCGASLPGWMFAWGVSLGLVACVVAVATSAGRVGRVAFTVQLLAECVALTVILSHM
ncbi:MAG TPA: hypothetical protein VFH94_11705 [Streptomyces sp.]|nr:hypothetical protein [Streptomyces sp.]